MSEDDTGGFEISAGIGFVMLCIGFVFKGWVGFFIGIFGALILCFSGLTMFLSKIAYGKRGRGD